MVHKFLSTEDTTSLKGLAILFIILSHIGDGGFHHRIFVPLGGFGVAIFLILSGYGLMESYKKHGLENFFKKRLLRILIPYVLWVMTFIVIMLCLHQRILLSSIRYWFVEYIFLWYIVFFFALKHAYQYRWPLFCIVAIISFWILPCLQAQQSLSFLIGIAISERKSQLVHIQRRKLFQIAALRVVVGILAFAAKQWLAMHISSVPTSDILVVHNVDDDDQLRKFVQIITKCPIAIAIIIIMTQTKARLLKFNYLGLIAYELYLVHMPFYGLINCNYYYLLFFLLFISITSVVLGRCNRKITSYILDSW